MCYCVEEKIHRECLGQYLACAKRSVAIVYYYQGVSKLLSSLKQHGGETQSVDTHNISYRYF